MRRGPSVEARGFLFCSRSSQRGCARRMTSLSITPGLFTTTEFAACRKVRTAGEWISIQLLPVPDSDVLTF